MKKKGLSVGLFLFALLMLVFIKQDAAAASVVESKTEGTITWTLYDDGTLDISGTGEINSSLGFKNYKSTVLKKVIIEDTITSIGVNAFDGYSKLTSVTIPDSVTSIGRSAFHNCSSLTSITIPDSVTSIGYTSDSYNRGFTFCGCSSLTSVKLPNSVASLGFSEFCGCSSLTSITIPDSVTSIGDRAFYGCSSLTSITIPDSVTSIGFSEFLGCSSLTSITIPDSVTSIGHASSPYEIGYTFYGCSSLTSVKLSNSVTSIGFKEFYGCSSLTSITIPDSVTSIGNRAFYGCSSLTSITIPDSVTSIGYTLYSDEIGYTFYGCSSLTNVIIADHFSNDKLEINFKSTPWFISRMGTLKGSLGDIFYELDTAGNLSLKGSGKAFISDDNTIKDYVYLVKTITISNDSEIEVASLISLFKNTEKIINNSSTPIKLEYGDDFSWCDINDTTELIVSISNGTAIRVNKQLPKHYTIVFDGNGATSGSMNEITAEAGKTTTLPKNSFTKDHYVFRGWGYKPSTSPYSYDYQDEGGLYLSLSDAISKPIVTLYAIWTEFEKCTIKFYSNGGTGSIDSVSIYKGGTYTLPDNSYTIPDGKEFLCWEIDGKTYNPGDSLTINYDTWVYASWKTVPQEVSISFDSNGGSGVMDSETVLEGESYVLPENTFSSPEGKEFVCWMINGIKYNPGDSLTINCNTQVYAVWKDLPKEVLVSFHADGGSGSMNSESAYEGDSYTLPECEFTAPSGKEFDCWDINSNDYNPGDTITITGRTKIHAVWKDIITVKYNVSFYANGGSGTMSSETVESGATYTLPENTFTPANGYWFDSWKIDSVTYYPGDSITIESDVSIYAEWRERQKITIRFYSEHENNPWIATEFEGKKIKLPANFFTAPTGREFSCWAVDGTNYNPGDIIVVKPDLKVYAVWKDKVSNPGTTDDSNQNQAGTDDNTNPTENTENGTTTPETGSNTATAKTPDTPQSQENTSGNGSSSNQQTEHKSAETVPEQVNTPIIQEEASQNAETTAPSDEEITISSGVTAKLSSDAAALTIKSITAKKNVTIPSKADINGKAYPVTALGKKLVSGKKVNTITINAANLKKVDKNAFKGAKSLKKIIIKGVKKGTKIAKQLEKAAKKANKNVNIVYK